MTVDEVIEIKQAMSLETANMSVSEMQSYYSQGAQAIQRRIDEIRAGTDAEGQAEAEMSA